MSMTRAQATCALQRDQIRGKAIKNIVFTLITTVLVPLLFFVLLELGLGLFGVGTSYDYFHKIDINGEPHYQENPHFADQFYPPSLDIGPLENTFSAERSPELVRVFVLGGSAALGFPHKNHGFDRFLATQLRAALPSRKIEVINTAMTSVNSHVVYAVARSIPKDSADFAVVLMGNNEVVGPYGPGTFNQNFLESISAIRGLQALKRTRIWQALNSLLHSVQASDARQELEWEGMQMFTNYGVPHDDPRLDSVYSHYNDNLIGIIETLHDKGMHVLLSSVPVNLRHSAPFLSVQDASLSADQLQQWETLQGNGDRFLDEQDWPAAVAVLTRALAIDAGYADTHFKLATAYENLNDEEKSKHHYQRALDLDALRFRADTQINQIVKDIAAEFAGESLSFVDNAAAFESASSPYQPGWNLLLEHVHYDFAGNHVLAAETAASIAMALDPDSNYQTLPGNEVARRIGFPNYDTIEEIKNLQGMIKQPPFPGQSNYAELERFLDEKLARIKKGVGTQREIVQRRQAVVDAGLTDWKVHFELAVLNQRLRNPPAMYAHLNKILELYPHNRETYMKIADAKSRERRWPEVIPYLQQSMFYTRGDTAKIAEAINWMGTAYLRIGDYDNAKKQLLQLPEDYPEQIDLTLKAFANLIRYARQQAMTDDVESYARDVERYANTLVRQGKDEDYPLLRERMVQIMNMAGDSEAASKWAE